MADYGLKDAMSAIDQMIAQQQAAATQKPTGIFGNVDPVMLGLAQGLLSPTKTGGFGESVGLGLSGASAPLAAMKKQQLDAQNKIQELQLARAKLAMEAPYWQSRADYYLSGGPQSRPDSTTERRNLITNQMQAIALAVPGTTMNPDTGRPFVDQEEIDNYAEGLRSQLLALDAKGAPQRPSASSAAKSGDTSTKTETPKKSEDQTTEEGILDKTKKFLGLGGGESATPKKTPPKDYPDAKIGAGGHWYVIRDGKPYRVDE